MPKISRQEKAYTMFRADSARLLRHDGHNEAADELEAIFSYPGIANCLEQAFSNVLWKEDEREEKAQAQELEQVVKMIPKIADPDDVNTKKIIQFLQTLIDEAEQQPEVMSQADIDAELGDIGEEDNTPLI